jgi:hypothetical protein
MKKKNVFLLAGLIIAIVGACSQEQIKKAQEESDHPNHYIQIDDMIIQTHQIDGGLHTLGNRGVSIDLWKHGVLPIEFASNVPNNKREQFMEICEEWAEGTRLRCRRGSYDGRKIYVSMENEEGRCGSSQVGQCKKFLGMFSCKTKLKVSEFCWDDRTILHELGHAIGLMHEHNRPDRDTYIHINEEYIDTSYDMDQIRDNLILMEGHPKGPYDFGSIMHYSPWVWSNGEGPTITVQPEYESFSGKIAYHYHRGELSKLDKMTVIELYGSEHLSYDESVRLTEVIYNALLFRDPDIPGSNGWRYDIAKGGFKGFRETARLIAGSDEFRSHIQSNYSPEEIVTQWYNVLFCREPDPGGLDHHANLVASGQAKRTIEGMINSREFMNKYPHQECWPQRDPDIVGIEPPVADR